MIEDFYDRIHDCYISLGAMKRNAAIDHLIDCGIDAKIAVEHVDNSLRILKCGDLSVPLAMQKFLDMGLSEREARQYTNDDTYDLLSFDYPPYYPVKSINFKSRMDHRHAELSISTQTSISLLYLSNLLTPRGQCIYPPKEIFHDRHTEFNRYPGIYNLIIYFDDDEETMIAVLNHIFDQLENIHLQKQFQQLTVRDRDQLTFSSAREGCIEFAKHFCHARAQGFPGGNYRLRNFSSRETALVNEKVTSDTKKLYHAICARQKDEVHQLLRAGVSPNAYFYGSSLIAYIFPDHNNGREKASAETILSIFALLLEYGAVVDKGFNFGSALATIIFYALSETTDRNAYAIFTDMLFMLMLIDDGKTYCYMDEKLKLASEFTMIVAQGQAAVIKNKSIPRAQLAPITTNKIEYQFHKSYLSTPSILRYTLNQQAISIRTMLLADLPCHLEKDLFSLFKNSSTWKDKFSAQDLEKYYQEIMTDMQGTPYIDLVYIEDKLVGYNVAQLIACELNNEQILIHHVKLAVSELSQFRGLNFFMSHQRSFLPLTKGLKTKVLTVFEAASPASVLQITDFDHYPKQNILEKYLPLLRDTIYTNMKERLIYDELNRLWYISDPLATFKKNQEPPIWRNRTFIAAERLFKNQVFKTGKSIIVMYESSESNHEKYLAKLRNFIELNEHMDTPNQCYKARM